MEQNTDPQKHMQCGCLYNNCTIHENKNQKNIEQPMKQNIPNFSKNEKKIESALVDIKIINRINRRPHCDFIIGRGKKDKMGNLNLQLNKNFNQRNIIYIDPDVSVGADVQKLIQDVDFSEFGISIDFDPKEEINIRFIFDWACFYCTAIDHMMNIVQKLNRRCEILVPLNFDESLVPTIIKTKFSHPFIRIGIIDGQYPLFDWTTDTHNISKVINPSKYILISAYQ